MTKAELEDLRERLAKVPASMNTYYNWRNGRTPMPEYLKHLFPEINK